MSGRAGLLRTTEWGPASTSSTAAARLAATLRHLRDRMAAMDDASRLGVSAQASADEIVKAASLLLGRYDPRRLRQHGDPLLERYAEQVCALVNQSTARLVERLSHSARPSRDVTRRSPSAPPSTGPVTIAEQPPSPCFVRATKALREHRYSDAKNLFAQALKHDPKNTACQAALELASGLHYKSVGEVDRAMPHFERAYALDRKCTRAAQELVAFAQRKTKRRPSSPQPTGFIARLFRR